MCKPATRESEAPPLATKTDVSNVRTDLERQTRQIIMWFIGMSLTLLGLIAAGFLYLNLYLNEQLNAILRSLP